MTLRPFYRSGLVSNRQAVTCSCGDLVWPLKPFHLHFRLSNLFHGLGDKSPQKADVYLSLLKLSKEAELASMVITDLEQVRLHIHCCFKSCLTDFSLLWVFFACTI